MYTQTVDEIINRLIAIRSTYGNIQIKLSESGVWQCSDNWSSDTINIDVAMSNDNDSHYEAIIHK
jgi:hypothetical protein